MSDLTFDFDDKALEDVLSALETQPLPAIEVDEAEVSALIDSLAQGYSVAEGADSPETEIDYEAVMDMLETMGPAGLDMDR